MWNSVERTPATRRCEGHERQVGPRWSCVGSRGASPSCFLMSQMLSPLPFFLPKSHRSCRKPCKLSPVMSSIIVDFPLPLPPSTTHFSRSRTLQHSRSKTLFVAYCTVTSRKSTIVAAAASAAALAQGGQIRCSPGGCGRSVGEEGGRTRQGGRRAGAAEPKGKGGPRCRKGGAGGGGGQSDGGIAKAGRAELLPALHLPPVLAVALSLCPERRRPRPG
mmetsp:Transcript_14777/g.43616  ORF Transcript_14777/g.43616 Transcript_14777/m.43616 type:complete len:219 (+) Transcript_14777:271-927(+)